MILVYIYYIAFYMETHLKGDCHLNMWRVDNMCMYTAGELLGGSDYANKIAKQRGRYTWLWSWTWRAKTRRSLFVQSDK
jgi:hypothetical protein